MKILLTLFILFFSFKLIAKEIQYVCTEWELVLPEYAEKTFFTEKRGVPFISIEDGDQFILKNDLETLKVLNFIGWYNDIIRIFTSYSSEYNSTSVFFLKWEKDGEKINKNILEIMKFAYNTQWTYKTNCYKN